MSATPAPRRRLRNFLLEPRFQLKYAALLAGSALVVLAGLAPLLLRATDDAALQAGRALREGRTSGELVQSQVLAGASDNPELVATVNARLAELREQTDRELRRVEQQRGRVRAVLAGGSAVLLAVLALLGVVVTHRVVGPAYKLRRLLRGVREGRLEVRESLRRGDDLRELFDELQGAIGALREARQREVAELERALGELEAPPADLEGAVRRLRALRDELAATLPAGPSAPAA